MSTTIGGRRNRGSKCRLEVHGIFIFGFLSFSFFWLESLFLNPVVLRSRLSDIDIRRHSTTPTRAEIILVTTAAAMDRDFERTMESFDILKDYVQFIVVAPPFLCKEVISKGFSCHEEAEFSLENGNGLPLVSRLIKGSMRSVETNSAKWFGIMNGDISFDLSLVETLRSISAFSRRTPVVVSGQRIDVDWETKEERLHSVWGMDYFIFNRAGAEYAVGDGVIPPLTIARIRWDSWLMGYLSSSDSIETIDASKTIRVLHFMNLSNAFVSKRSTDLTNLKLAGVEFRLGHLDNANYRVAAPFKLEPLKSTQEVREEMKQNHTRWKFDLILEEATNYTFSTVGMPVQYYYCLCNILFSMHSSSQHEKAIPWNQVCERGSSSANIALLKKRVFLRREVLDAFGRFNATEFDGVESYSKERKKNLTNCCFLIEQAEGLLNVPEKAWSLSDYGKSSECFVKEVHQL